MTQRAVVHSTFVIERTYKVSPDRVFAAFSSAQAKSRWFAGGDDMEPSNLQLDFRVGGRETTGGAHGDGPVYKYEAIYQDIVPDERIVSTYNMWMDDALISVSIATVELKASGGSTLLKYTEQGAFLDGLDQPSIREHGVRELYETLGNYLERQRGARV